MPDRGKYRPAAAARYKCRRFPGREDHPDGRVLQMSRQPKSCRSALAGLLAVAAVACSSGNVGTSDDRVTPAQEAPATNAAPGRITSEPQAPDWLELTQVGAASADGSVTFEAVVRPEADGDVELEIVSPPGLSFASGARSQRRQVRRDGPPVRERLSWNRSANPDTDVVVRLRLLDENGNPTLVIDRTLAIAERRAPAGQERVSVVRTLPDGSRIVQRMTRAEARRQGLTVEEPPTRAAEVAAQEDTLPDAGDDRPPPRLQR